MNNIFTSIFKKEEWFSNIQGDILAGILVSLALIPEAISFSIIAGVDPKVGLYASCAIPMIIAFLGGRLAMISAATGGMAVLMITLVKDYGLEYLLAATILAGIFQILWGYIKLGNQMRFVPRGVIVGFLNAIAIIILRAQISQLKDASSLVFIMIGMGLLIIYGLPFLVKKTPLKVIPSPLVAIVALTIISISLNLDIPTVNDMGTLPNSIHKFNFPQVKYNLDTLNIILPYSLGLSLVGLLQSFLTANVIDDLTDTSSNRRREAIGQGIANIITGFLGGMAGAAMIGQSVINVENGGRTRLSTFSAGFLLLVFMLTLGYWVGQIPMAALIAVMIMVSISTFNWKSITNIKSIPKNESAVMLTTVVITLLTNNLSMGVIVGVAMSAIFFSRKIAALVFVDSYLKDNGVERIYSVSGQIFFVSIEIFLASFDFHEKLETVTINLTEAHLWDQSSVDAIDKVVVRFSNRGTKVNLIGLNEASADLLDRLAVYQHNTDSVQNTINSP